MAQRHDVVGCGAVVNGDIDTRPRVLCIAGSPRRHGNSDRLLDAVEIGVQSAGGTPLRLVVSSAGISPCRGCNSCASTGRCIVRDSMDEIYPLLDEAAAIVVATPVYFATVPATLKALYDRCQPYWARRYVLGEAPLQRRRPGALLLVGGGGDPYGTQCSISPTSSVFAVLGVEMTETLELIGADAAGDVEKNPESLERAEMIGRTLVESSLAP
jgi:multimeric flavodoxin WrbA